MVAWPARPTETRGYLVLHGGSVAPGGREAVRPEALVEALDGPLVQRRGGGRGITRSVISCMCARTAKGALSGMRATLAAVASAMMRELWELVFRRTLADLRR